MQQKKQKKHIEKHPYDQEVQQKQWKVTDWLVRRWIHDKHIHNEMGRTYRILQAQLEEKTTGLKARTSRDVQFTMRSIVSKLDPTIFSGKCCILVKSNGFQDSPLLETPGASICLWLFDLHPDVLIIHCHPSNYLGVIKNPQDLNSYCLYFDVQNSASPSGMLVT